MKRVLDWELSGLRHIKNPSSSPTDGLQGLKVFRYAISSSNLLQDVTQRASTNSTGGTLSTGFIYGEVQVELGNVYDTVILVHDDHTTASHHGTDAHQRPEIDGGIKIRFGDNTTAKGPPVCTALNLRLLAIPPPISKTISRKVVPMGTSTQTGVSDLTGKGKDLGSPAVSGTNLAEPVTTFGDDEQGCLPKSQRC